MSAVQITNITVLQNPCGFLDPFRLEITFEASQELEEDLEWRLTYVGSADSEMHDQQLDSVLVGPVPVGVNRFLFEAPAPDASRIPPQDLLGVTVVLLECLYKDNTFVRVGYYVSNEDPDDPKSNQTSDKDGKQMDDEVDMMDVEDLRSEDEEDDVDGEGEEDGDKMVAEGEEMEEPCKENQGETTQGQPAPRKPAVVIHPSKIKRYILDDKPRVTRFPIDWDEGKTDPSEL